MAMPYINLLAPSMGGIGPIELSDLSKLDKLKEGTGVDFYAGRFYPKDSKAIIEGLSLGLISQTPPWLTWEEIQDTQIWMIPAFENERILSMDVTIDRIDLWPRDDEDPAEIPEFNEDTNRHQRAKESWRHDGAGYSVDPSIIVTQNVVPPILFNGFVGISEISGRVSEYGFYDSELHIINARDYGQQHKAEYRNAEKYEIKRLREDGIWTRRTDELPKDENGALVFIDDGPQGYPSHLKWDQAERDYSKMVHSDYTKAGKYGNDSWDYHTRWVGEGTEYGPEAGLIAMRPSRLDTIVLTVKVSCITAVIPDFIIPPDTWTGILDYSTTALETFASNQLLNQFWYFYWPVRFNGDLTGVRMENLLARAGINRVQNEDYRPPDL